MKRLITLILCAVMLLALLPAAPMAQAAAPKLVAITFDDGPGAYTARLLDGLAQRGAKATFFMVGSMMSGRMTTVKRMVKEGHQIANHTYSHPDLNTLSAASIRNELSRTRNLLVQAGGEQTYCLRPPYGNHNATVRSNAGGPVILWSVDTLDWQSRNANTVYNKIINQTRDGSIVLLHDIYSTSVDAALRAIDTLQARGYECVTVSELFRRRAVPMETGKTYSCAYNKGITLPAVEPPATPSVTVNNVYGGKRITLSCSTADSSVYYTLDGSKPDEKSKKYSGAFTLSATTRLRAVAINKGGSSKELDSRITVLMSPSPTAVTLQGGKASLTPAAGTLIYYTTDGAVPTTASKKYTAPVAVRDRLNVRIHSVGKADRLISYSFTPYGHILIDTPADGWYFPWVGKAMERGIMKGLGNMEFAPEGAVTRGMFVTALHRLSPDSATPYAATTFTDVSKKSWYAAGVAWAQANGIVKGMTAGEFMPDAPITREQMCVMLARYLDYYNCQLSVTQRKPFADDGEISPWAKDGVYRLYGIGLVNGMGKNVFAPRDGATRGQCAKLLVLLDDMTNHQNII